MSKEEDTIFCVFIIRKRLLREKFPQKKEKVAGLHEAKSTTDAPPGTRTLDTLIKSQVLYQLS